MNPNQQQGHQQNNRTRQNRRPRQTNRDRAIRDINPDAPPYDLSNLVSAITSRDRGNVQVVYDDQVIERVASESMNVIASVKRSRNHIDQNGNPVDLEVLSAGSAIGLSLGMAKKLVVATPQSQLASVVEFNNLNRFDLRVPKTYVQLIDLVGKTKVDESSSNFNIRVKYNDMQIKRFLTKALKYGSLDQGFLNNYIPNGNGEHALLQGLQQANIFNIVYEDNSSAQFIKDTVKARLKDLLSRNLIFNGTDANGQPVALNFSIPQFNVDDHNRQDILGWLGQLDNVLHADPNDANYFTDVLSCGLLLLINQFWLQDMNAQVAQLDNAFANVPFLAGLTVQNLLNAGNFFHIQEFVARANFKTFYEGLFAHYNQTVSPMLTTIFQMVNIGNASFGAPGQMVFVDPDDFENIVVPPAGVGFNRTDLRHGTSEAYSVLRVESSDQIVKSAMYGLTKSVEVETDYWISFSVDLRSTRSQHVARDSILLSNIRHFNT